MAFNKRERLLVVGAAAVIGLLGIDQYFLTPLFNDEDQLQVQRQKLLADLGHAHKTMTERKELMPKWNIMLKTGLKADHSEAEQQLYKSLGDWAKETGLTPPSLTEDTGQTQSPMTTDRPEAKATLKELNLQANTVGSMESIAKFLWKMQSAAFPLKLTEFQMGAQNETNKGLTLQFKISTLYNETEQHPDKSDKPSDGEAQ